VISTAQEIGIAEFPAFYLDITLETHREKVPVQNEVLWWKLKCKKFQPPS
jgi:hypothetical protein